MSACHTIVKKVVSSVSSLSTNAITIKNGFTVPMSREYMKRHNGHRIRIPFPDKLKDKTIQEVRICPMYGGRYFKIQYCYLQDPNR